MTKSRFRPRRFSRSFARRQRWKSSGRSLRKSLRDWTLAIAIVFLLARLVFVLGGQGGLETAHLGIARLADGDSLTLNGERIRLWGIDAPELDQICWRKSETYPCGKAAKDQLQSLVGSRQVSCQGLKRDKYGRLIATCEAGGVGLNKAMVESGWAVAYGGYLAQELKARTAKLGLWEGTFDTPRDWRDGNRRVLADDFHPDWLGRIGVFVRESLMTVFSGLISERRAE